MVVTAYCPCRECCGHFRGKIKGQTASGTMARPGTIAADTSLYPFGTIMYIPGYGYGIVEDRGGAVKGNRVDVYFPRHHTAVEWGSQRIIVQIRSRPVGQPYF